MLESTQISEKRALHNAHEQPRARGKLGEAFLLERFLRKLLGMARTSLATQSDTTPLRELVKIADSIMETLHDQAMVVGVRALGQAARD